MEYEIIRTITILFTKNISKTTRLCLTCYYVCHSRKIPKRIKACFLFAKRFSLPINTRPVGVDDVRDN